VTIVKFLDGFVRNGFNAIAVSHVQLFLNGPFLVIVVKTVRIFINIFVQLHVISHTELAAFSHTISDWFLRYNEHKVDAEA